MVNQELSQIFDQMAEFLEMGEISFRSKAYRRAGRFLASLEEDLEEIYAEGGTKALEKLPGIGKGLAEKIEEYIKTDKIKDYRKLQKACPVDLKNLTRVEGLGARKIKVLYQKLKIKNLDDLEKAAKKGKIKDLEGFGEKSEKNILENIAFAKAGQEKMLLGDVLPFAEDIVSYLKKLNEVEKISIAGSLRRMRAVIGDVDILTTSKDPKKVIETFVKMPEVAKVWAKGETKSSVRLKVPGAGEIDCDLRVVKNRSFGSALQYFTGSKDHNIALRKIAIKKGYKLNEYGLFKKEERIAGINEEEIYNELGLDYPEPELRTNNGEIEAALDKKLPKLVELKDIRGDCHMHTTWSDGISSIKEMAQKSKEMGYEYVVISDHARPGLKITYGLDETKIKKQIEVIDKLNEEIDGIRILKGCEVNIKSDGSLDIKDEILQKLDIVSIGVHSWSRMDRIFKDHIEKRILKAMDNPYVNVLVHPTGRLLLERKEYLIDVDKIIDKAKEKGVALEINSYSKRLDLNDKNIRKTIKKGVKLIINTDAHSMGGLSNMRLGVAQARRGWAQKKDILNTLSVDKLLAYFHEKK